jgi:CheY-like chemotaxis protein
VNVDSIASRIRDADNGAVLMKEEPMEQNILLIVDDDVAVAGVMKNYLKRRVSEVYTAEGYEEAVRILEQKAVNVLVCDFELASGEMNGGELVRKLRKRFPSIQRAMVCSGPHSTNIRRSKDIDEVLDKTVDFDKLRLFVQRPFK